MLKSVLVAAAGSPQTDAALETAASLAHPFRGHIECLRIHPDPAQMLAIASSPDMGSGIVLADLWQAMRDDDLRRTEAARQTFDEFCKRRAIEVTDRPGEYSNVTASWRDENGSETDQLIARGYYNDLTVLENVSGGGGLPASSAGTVLLNSGRPLLIAAPEALKRFPRTIAVAWKKTPEAARALTAAMPLLTKAERVVVVAVNEDLDSEAQARLSMNSALDHLRWHGVNVEGRFTNAGPISVLDMMLAEIRSAGAELLVMGGYGHGRLREYIFGGFTQRVLSGVQFPVFLHH